MKLGDGVRAILKLARPWRPQPLQPARTVPQLCAIAGKVYEPAITDAEWSARIKDVVAKEGAEPALPHEISAAMATMTRKLRRPEPIVTPRQPLPFPQPQYPRVSREEASRLIADLEARLTRRHQP